MNAIFNANSQENQALVANAVATVQANIVAANPTEDPGLVQGTVYDTVSADDTIRSARMMIPLSARKTRS